MSTPMLTVSEVYKSYGKLEVLKDVSLEVERGSVVSILGPSGSGKSTLLRCINHLEPLDSGLIRLEGESIGYHEKHGKFHELKDRQLSKQRTEIGMVFQSFNLFGHMTALQNVMVGPRAVLGKPGAECRELAQNLLQEVGLADFGGKYPAQLSGGQQQRVAIARAMAMSPKVLLFDEPTSALDPQLVGEVLDVIARLARTGMTMIIVTHEIHFAREVSDEVIVMRNARIIEQGPPHDVLDNPQHEETRAFLGHSRPRNEPTPESKDV